MPMNPEELEELRGLIGVARKRPLGFGLCLGKSPEGTVFLMHRLKDGEVLARSAKKQGETAKVSYGTAEVKGKVLSLTCNGDIVPGMAKTLKRFLKANDMALKVIALDPSGNVTDDDGEPEEGAADSAAPGGAGVDIEKRQFLLTRWRQIPTDIEVELGKFAAAVRAKVPDENPDELSAGVRDYFARLLSELNEELQDAIDASVNAGDQSYSAVGRTIEAIRGKVAGDKVLKILKRNSITAGEPFEAAIGGALDEIATALTA